MEDYQLHPKNMEHPNSPADDGTPTMPDQRLVAVAGEEAHQSHSKDVGTITEPDTPTLLSKSRHYGGPTTSKPSPEFNPDALVGRTFLPSPADNGERLREKEKSYILGIDMEKWRKSSTISNFWIICHIWIDPAFHLNYKRPQVLKVLKLNLYLILRNIWKVRNFHQQIF